jgi:hypothetical protein
MQTSRARVSPLLAAILCGSIVTGAAQGANAPAAEAVPGSGQSYEVVTVQRPESVNAYQKPYRMLYETCAALRKAKSLPPPAPMAPLPADFVIRHKTYISDGAAWYFKEAFFSYDVDASADAPTCATRVRRHLSIEVVRDGMKVRTDVDDEGKRRAAPPEPANPRRRRQEIHTVPKVVKGYAVKCLQVPAAGGAPLGEFCVADLKPGTLYYNGQPIVVAGRDSMLEKLQGATLIEPVLLKAGQQVDGSVFDAAGKR